MDNMVRRASRRRHRISGFTLIELMIVVAIIGVLASIAIPKFADLVTRSKEAAVKGQLGSVRSALTIYYADNEGTLPGVDLNAALTTNAKYLQVFPAVSIPSVSAQGNPGHSNMSWLTDVSVKDCGFNYWIYNPGPTDSFLMATDGGTSCGPFNPGAVYLVCNHNDSRGTVWWSY